MDSPSGPKPRKVTETMLEVLQQLTILPWTSEEAHAYGLLRARNGRPGITIGALDMLIAAHAVSRYAVLVTSDAAMAKLKGGPEIINWADDVRPN